MSEKSSNLIRPAGVFPTAMSKKTMGRPLVPAPVAILGEKEPVEREGKDEGSGT